MDFNTVTYLSYIAAGITFILTTAVLTYKCLRKLVHWSLPLAAMVSAIWLFSFSIDYQNQSLQPLTFLLYECLRQLAWIFALISTLKFLNPSPLPLSIRALPVLALAISLIALAYTSSDSEHFIPAFLWSGLLLSVVGLICIEQLYKNIAYNRPLKLLCLSALANYIFDVYLFTHTLIFQRISPELWQARAVVIVITAFLITIAALALSDKRTKRNPIALSRSIAFYTASLSGAGLYISILAIGGHYVKTMGGQWSTVIYTLITFGSLMLLVILLSSKHFRELMKVAITKHLFRHKYDYRSEWLKLINHLAQPVPADRVHAHATDAVLAIVKSSGAGLWCIDGDTYRHHYHYNMALPSPYPKERQNSVFCQILHDEQWMFIPNSDQEIDRTDHNPYIPLWISNIPQLWLILPLLAEDELFGFMILTKPPLPRTLTWEDRDLLKTVGRQLASYLSRHQQAEQLIETQRFDTFHKLSAFVMHDLKNLIAQQALVVQNAAKHKNNPDFFADAIATIDNSVKRMGVLLKKLQPQEGEQVQDLSLRNLVNNALDACGAERPTPSLHWNNKDATIRADHEKLLMSITHLLKNAQDATPNTGFIDLTLEINANKANITIEDNGSGMDDAFIQQRLFKPFETTKTGKGMGIGLYLSKTYIQSLGGNLTVNSTPGEGSSFRIELPLVNSKNILKSDDEHNG